MSESSVTELPANVAGADDAGSHRIRGRGWPLERVLFVLAGTMTGLSALLSALVSPWFLLLTAFVAVNQLVFAAVNDCPASLILRHGFGVERAAGCG
ncbi:MAG TPA: hypothetical protein VH476_00255 [Solirubrobacterales bacterium]|jgi:hypothetical protein